MNRELDPQLFGPSGKASSAQSTPGSSSRYEIRGPAPEPRTEPGQAVPFPALDFKVLESQMTQLRAVIQQFDKRLDRLEATLGEFARDSQGKIDKVTHQTMRVEDGLARLTRDTADRLAALAGRVNERKVQDSKIQEMVDRHNLLVRNFENRMESLQKLAGDQEQALLSAFAALEDTRADLARLKRL